MSTARISLATFAIGLVAPAALAQEPAVSRCSPVAGVPHPRALSETEQFQAGRRLALIENGSVPCVHQDTGRTTTCTFRTGVRGGKRNASGSWLAAEDGRRYAPAGQPVSRDGRRPGDHVIAARVVDGAVPCVAAAATRGTSGVPVGQELHGACIVETPNASTNTTGQPLRNVATIPVCTRTHPHPDGASVHSFDPAAGVYCYVGAGAGLNAWNGQERDANGNYLPVCHVLWSSGLEVFAAKRPATKGYPRRVDTKSELAWRPYVSSVRIAN
jgi:hypothetical protein